MYHRNCRSMMHCHELWMQSTLNQYLTVVVVDLHLLDFVDWRCWNPIQLQFVLNVYDATWMNLIVDQVYHVDVSMLMVGAFVIAVVVVVDHCLLLKRAVAAFFGKHYFVMFVSTDR